MAWAFLEPHRGWLRYDAASADAIEAAFRGRAGSLQLSLAKSGAAYLLDLERMTQRNLSTQFVRPIRREAADAVPSEARPSHALFPLQSSSTVLLPRDRVCRAARLNKSTFPLAAFSARLICSLSGMRLCTNGATCCSA